MRTVRIIIASLMGGAFGIAGIQFLINEDWGLLGLCIGNFLAVWYIILWGFAFHYDD